MAIIIAKLKINNAFVGYKILLLEIASWKFGYKVSCEYLNFDVFF
jgi:hypothetical protein